MITTSLTTLPNISLIFLLGLIIGSFLNVIIYRLPRMILYPETKLSLLLPFSQCTNCHHTLKPWHNIPLVSYIFLKGKCAYCKTSISTQYPIVELITAVLSCFVFSHFGMSLVSLAALVFIWLVIPLSVIDMHHKILPDTLNYTLLWTGLLFSLSSTFINTHQAIIGASSGYLSFWLVANSFKLMTKKDGLGHGDFKLAAALGAWLGWKLLPLTIFIAAFIGLFCSIFYLWINKGPKDKLKSIQIPFGPYLALAGLIALLWGQQLYQLYFNFLLGN